MYVQIAVIAPIKIDLLWYSIPAELLGDLEKGDIVLVPLRGKFVDGIAMSFSNECPLKNPPLSIHKKTGLPRLPIDALLMAEFASKYYLVPLYQPIKLLFPQIASKKGKKRLSLIQATSTISPSDHLSMDALFVLSMLKKSPQKNLLWQTITNRMKLASDSVTAEQILFELKQSQQIVIDDTDEKTPESLPHTLDEPLSEKTEQKVSIPIIFHSDKPKDLSPEQKTVLNSLGLAMEKVHTTKAPLSPAETTFLLHGVTGSGKTEVYLRLIEETLAKGKTSLVLVPEIGLTPQFLSLFQSRFGTHIAVIHSGLTPQQRLERWQDIANQKVSIVLGARSALFSPLKNLGLIIVDEEHDSSFKQQDGFRYQGRDLALVRAVCSRSLIVLGSATPSLESWQLVEQNKASLLTMKNRPFHMTLPDVQLVDLKKYSLGHLLLSTPLIQAIQHTLNQKKQTILFLNRRGYASFVLCKSCGYKLECPHCAVTLTWHKSSSLLLCHYCAYKKTFIPTETNCPSCQAHSLHPLGMGTQKIQEQVERLFPHATIARIDRDNAKDLTQTLTRMHQGEIDILIGTQMIAKGHDFSKVSLVGVVLADTSLGLPDFRASEKTFQLLMQVAGRSGRNQDPGQVLIQTYLPKHHALYFAAQKDYNGFVEKELSFRKELLYPPYTKLVLVKVDGHLAQATESAIQTITKNTQDFINQKNLSCKLLGPVPAPISKLKGQVRFQLFLKSTSANVLHQVASIALKAAIHLKDVRVSVDFDPASVL